MDNSKVEQITLLKEELAKMEEKTFNVYFFTFDSKGMHSGYLTYIYETALQLKKMGYNVHMLHQETDFVGVASWLGDEYSELPHHNIEKEKINLSVSDVLFIPELFSNVMKQTSKVPCKRVVILQNYDYLTQVIPAGQTWGEYGIRDCITTTEHLKGVLGSIFPNVKTRIVSPLVREDVFFDPEEPKKLIVNIVSKSQTDVNNIVKTFYWRYPMYRWVAFREVKGLSKKDFAETLKESAFTVWVDMDSEFGYSAIEAMKCGSIVIGKVPETTPEWMMKDGEFVNNGVWFYNNEDVPMLIAGAIESYINDGISSEVYEQMCEVRKHYTTNTFANEIKETYVDDIFETHKNGLKILVDSLDKNKN